MEFVAPPWAKILVTVALKMAVESRLCLRSGMSVINNNNNKIAKNAPNCLHLSHRQSTAQASCTYASHRELTRPGKFFLDWKVKVFLRK